MKSRRMIRKLRKHRLLVIVLLIVMSFTFPVHISASERINYDDIRVKTLNMGMKTECMKEKVNAEDYPLVETVFSKNHEIHTNMEEKSTINKDVLFVRQYFNDRLASYQVYTELKGIAEHRGDGSGIIHIGTTALDHTVINPLICLIVLCGYTVMIFENSRSEEYLC